MQPPSDTAPAGSDATLLDLPETNSPPAERITEDLRIVTSDDPPVIFRHRGWQRHRAKVEHALELAGRSCRTVDRFRLCGSNVWIARDPANPERLALLADTCHSRWCRPCAQARSRVIAANLARAIDERPHRLITLTIRSSDTPLHDQLDSLYRHFRVLRRTKLWRDHVDGGAAVCEVTYNRETARWHPHLHAIVTGTYLPRQQLIAEWQRVTSDSWLVDVRMIRTKRQVAGYVAKYVSKQADRTVINHPDKLAELIRAMHGRRLVLTFGTWRGIKLLQRLDDTNWEPLYPMSDLHRLVVARDPLACKLFQMLTQTQPRMIELFAKPPPNPAIATPYGNHASATAWRLDATPQP